MDALMAALVAALLIQASDRTAWLAARLGDRFARPGGVAIALIGSLAMINAIGAVGGALIAPVLTPEAGAVLLALALITASAPMLFRPRAPDDLPDSRMAALPTSALALLALGLGDRTQFVTFALAAGTPLPALPGIGATIGAIAVTLPAVLMGERRYLALPLGAIRIVCCVVLLVAGLVIGLDALRLL